MKKYLSIAVLSALFASTASAGEYRFATGKFNWKLNFPFMSTDIDQTVGVLSYNEAHSNILSSKFFYYYNVDLYTAKLSNKLTSYIKEATTTIPKNPMSDYASMASKYSPISVPTEFKIHGIDANVGLGYDLVNDKKFILGVGVNTGLSLPYLDSSTSKDTKIKMPDIAPKVDMGKTDMFTYKLGPMLYAQLNITKKLSAYASGSYGYQVGWISNAYLGSSLTVHGQYNYIDIGLRYRPWEKNIDLGFFEINPSFYLTAGYMHKEWKINDIKVTAFKNLTAKLGGVVKNRFKNDYGYLGIGYSY